MNTLIELYDERAILRFLERRFDPLFLILKDSLISGNDRLESTKTASWRSMTLS